MIFGLVISAVINSLQISRGLPFSLRNIEDILAERGEEILRVDDSTLEVKGQDVVGSHKLQAAVSSTHQERREETSGDNHH